MSLATHSGTSKRTKTKETVADTAKCEIVNVQGNAVRESIAARWAHAQTVSVPSAVPALLSLERGDNAMQQRTRMGPCCELNECTVPCG